VSSPTASTSTVFRYPVGVFALEHTYVNELPGVNSLIVGEVPLKSSPLIVNKKSDHPLGSGSPRVPEQLGASASVRKYRICS